MKTKLLSDDLSMIISRYRNDIVSVVDNVHLVDLLNQCNIDVTRLSKQYAIDRIAIDFTEYAEKMADIDMRLLWYESDFRKRMNVYCGTNPIKLSIIDIADCEPVTLIPKNKTISLLTIGAGTIVSVVLWFNGLIWVALAVEALALLGGALTYPTTNPQQVKARFVELFDQYSQTLASKIELWIEGIAKEGEKQFNDFTANYGK